MKAYGNAGPYVGATQGRPLPVPGLSHRPSGAAPGWACPTCGFRARRQTFHLCVEPEKAAAIAKRPKVTPAPPLTEDELARRFSPDVQPAVDEQPITRPEEATMQPAPAPRVRARVRQASPATVIVTLGSTDALNAVEVAALLTDLLAGLNHQVAPATAEKPATASRKKRKAITPEMLTEAVRRYEAGASIQAVADALGVSFSGLRHRMVEAGVTFRPQRRYLASRP